MLLKETSFILQNFTSHALLAERSDLDPSVDKGEGRAPRVRMCASV